MSVFLFVAGFAGLAVGLIGAFNSSLLGVRLASRRPAVALIATGFFAMMAGAALADPQPQDESDESAITAPTASPTPTSGPATDVVLQPVVEGELESEAAVTPPAPPAVAAPSGRRAIAATPPAPPALRCDPAYPDFCIPPRPPDLNCADIDSNDFTVREPDLHGLDGDNDGVGCESGNGNNSAPAPPEPPPPPPSPPDPPDPQDPPEPPAPPPPPPPPPDPPPPPPSPPSGSSCDPSYPEVCIASPPPDLDCPQVPYTDFAVTGSDPHGFDADNDGIGCES